MMPIASLSWFFVILIKATSEVDLGAYSGFADALNFSAGLTTNGILFLLVSIGTIVMTFKARDEILNAGKLDRTIEPNQNAKAKVVGVAILPPDEVKDGRDVCLTFKLADGREINLFEKSEYQANLGDEGNLTWNGGIVVFFEKT